ncbi:hypothetical protein D3C72_948830 [compost metagenome]
MGLRIIGPQFAEGLDRVIDLIAARQEEVEAVHFGHDGQVFLGRVRQQGGVDIGRLLQAQAVSQGGGASGQGVRLDGEGGEALSAIGGGAGQGELAPGRQRGQAVQGRSAEARALEQRPLVVGVGEGLIQRRKLVAVIIVEEGRNIAAAVLDILAAIGGEVGLPHVGALGEAVLGRDGQVGHVVAQDGVDHPGHGVGAVDGGGAVAQDFQALEAGHRDGVGVVGQDRHQVLIGLGRGVADDAAAVQQDQGVADAEAAQVDRAGVAARRVGAGGQVGGVEGHVAHLWDGAQQFVAGGGGGRQDLFLADHGHGQGGGDLGAANLRADDDDLIDLGRRLFGGVLGDGGARRAEQGGGGQHGCLEVSAGEGCRHDSVSPLNLLEPGIPPGPSGGGRFG